MCNFFVLFSPHRLPSPNLVYKITLFLIVSVYGFVSLGFDNCYQHVQPGNLVLGLKSLIFLFSAVSPAPVYNIPERKHFCKVP